MPAHRNPRWTADELATLRESYVKGIRYAFEALPHRSTYSIIGKANKLGLKVEVPNLTGRAYCLAGNDLEEALRLREEGWSMLRIGARFGVCETAASNAIIREQCIRGGYTPADRVNGRLSQEAIQRLRWMLKKGLKAVEIQLRLGISAASVNHHRKLYDAELRAAGKAPLPRPGNGARYSGARVLVAKRKEVEALFLQGYGSKKASEKSGVSNTVCTRIRWRLIKRLKRKGECLPGCDIEGKRRVMHEHGRHIPPELRAKCRELILAAVPIRRAAMMSGIGSCSAYRIRNELVAELGSVPKPRLPGRTKPLQREMIQAQAIPAGKMWRYRQLVRELGDADKARTALREEMKEEKRSLTFEDQLQRVASGQANIAKVQRFTGNGPDFTLGGVSAGMV